MLNKLFKKKLSEAAKKEQNIKRYIKNAEKGDSYAQYSLGVCYKSGYGNITKDPLKAISWFTKAAEQGQKEAQYEIGLNYFQGNTIKQDLSQAEQWFTKAAEQGHIQAQKQLNKYYKQHNKYQQNKQDKYNQWKKDPNSYKHTEKEKEENSKPTETNLKKDNPFEILGIKETATETEIKNSYREKCKLWHPDTLTQKQKDDPKFNKIINEEMGKINKAYEEIKKKQKKLEIKQSDV